MFYITAAVWEPVFYSLFVTKKQTIFLCVSVSDKQTKEKIARLLYFELICTPCSVVVENAQCN